jgi:hypothetical protein
MVAEEEREAMEQVERVVRVVWVEEEKVGTSMSVTSAIRLILGAWRGQRTFLVVWRWMVKETLRMGMAGIKRLARIGLARMRECLC